MLAASLTDRISPLRNMMSLVGDCIGGTATDAAVQNKIPPDFSAFVWRYGQAGSHAKRRIDALIHEAGVEGLAGCRLIATRGDRTTPGTEFLHRWMRSALLRIDQLLPLAA